MPSVAELQAALQASRERFNAASAGVGSDTLENRAVCGVWSARDVAGHVTDWNAEFVAVVEHALGGPAPDGHPIEDGEAYNVQHAEARNSQSWDTAKSDLDASFERASALLEQIDDDQLSTPAMMPWGIEATVGEAIADVSAHADEHVADLENNLRAEAA